MQTRKIETEMEPRVRSAAIRKESVNQESREVDFVLATEREVVTIGFTDQGLERFQEVLGLRDGEVNLERLGSGRAPFLDSHDIYGSVRKQLGVITKAWVEGGELLIRVRFSKREEVEDIFQDVVDGIIANVSVGFRVDQYEEVEDDEDNKGMRTLRAVKWTPHEGSLVTVPADPQARKRQAENTQKVEINLKDKEQEPMKEKTESPQVEPTVDKESIRKEERERSAKILKAVRQAKLPEKFAEELISNDTPLLRALEMIQERWAELENSKEIKGVSNARVDVGSELDEVKTRREGAAEAVLHRSFPKDHELSERGHRYHGLTAMELARTVLEENGIKTRGMGRNEIVQRAFHSTSDFPAILADVASKRIQRGYQQITQAFKLFGVETVLKDFKPHTVAELGEAPDLVELVEGSEIKYGTIGDSKEVYSLATYARSVSVTRQTIINDDLGAFGKVAASFGRAAAQLENNVAMVKNFLDNPAMGDGENLFDNAAHKNVGTTGAPSATTLSELKEKMRVQTDDQGRKLNLNPKYALCGPKAEDIFRTLLASQSVQGGFNVHGGLYDLIVDPEIDDWAHYLIGDPGQIEGLEYAYLEGARGLQIESEMTTNVLGLRVWAYLDFGAKAINWRAFQKNAGASPT